MTVHFSAARHAVPERAPDPDPVRRPRPVRSWLDVKASPYLYVAPFFLLFAVFGVYPIGYTLWISLHDWPLGSDSSSQKWVGLANFDELIHQQQFWNSVYNTFGIFAVSTVPQLFARAVPGQPAEQAAAWPDAAADGDHHPDRDLDRGHRHRLQ